MIALFSQIADLTRCIAVDFPKLPPEVIGGTESADQAYFRTVRSVSCSSLCAVCSR